MNSHYSLAYLGPLLQTVFNGLPFFISVLYFMFLYHRTVRMMRCLMRKCSNCGETYRGLCKCHICTHFVSMMQVLCYLVAGFNAMLHLRDILGDLCPATFINGLEHRNSAGILLDSHLMEKFKNLYDKTIVLVSRAGTI